MERAFFTIWMEEFLKVLGKKIKLMDMDVKKDLTSMKDNGNLD